MQPEPTTETLVFVACVSDSDVFAQRLLASPCLQAGGHKLITHRNSQSAADAFNTTLRGLGSHKGDHGSNCGADQGANTWLVWVHQDVYLPPGWDTHFVQGLQAARAVFPQLAVVGVHGVAGAGALACRAGHVLDRGTELREFSALPCLVDSLDELLFAVRVCSGLTLDPALGWDFYGTDVVLQARAAGLQSAVIDAYCEHWSDTPTQGAMPAKLVQRILTSAAVFENKWQQHFPITTPCFDIAQQGDVQKFVDQFVVPVP
jgi:hypothetical protein